MAKITGIMDEVFHQVGENNRKRILFFDGGNITSQGKPWYRVFITDSDTGPIMVFGLSSQTHEEAWRPTIVKAVVSAINSNRIVPLSEEESITSSVVSENAPKKKGRPKGSSPKNVHRASVATPTKKRGRPRKNS
jgi:hypothetical protein